MPEPSDQLFRQLFEQLMAQRTVIDAIVATHPNPPAFLDAHRAQMEKLDRLYDSDSVSLLETVTRIHERYRQHFAR